MNYFDIRENTISLALMPSDHGVENMLAQYQKALAQYWGSIPHGDVNKAADAGKEKDPCLRICGTHYEFQRRGYTHLEGCPHRPKQ